MSEGAGGRRKPLDFLRQIVNVVLAESNLPPQVMNDIKKMIARAEDKYRFSVFGGDVRKLKDYFESPEFEDLINVVKSAHTDKVKALEVLLKILEKAKEAYKDYPDIVAVIEKKIEEVKRILEEREKELKSEKR